ncbi:MAG: tRNA pseudouridine(38-40) synthase TruA [Campylobacterota bacterium]|nr:tRNA pseudouridine(38-40) synthase TruA [Campylobacterota bacterium]
MGKEKYKIKLIISYDGSDYFGSQIQPDKITIQSELQDAFKKINIDTSCDFSGRTDRGVHAFKQTISCDIPTYWDNLTKLKDVLNRLLNSSIFIRYISKVDESFHSRFSATKREYRYLISSKKTTPFNDKYIVYYPNINIDKIDEVIKYFIGVHDFSYFSKTGSEPISTIREIYNIRFYKYKDIYVLNFIANSYLRSQIRMMVDFIIKVSQGKLTISQLQEQLSNKKLHSWTLAPSNGLYLSKIYY